MKYYHIISSVVLLTLFSCTDQQKLTREDFDLTGAWVLRHVEFPWGTEYDCSMDGNGTSCLIYDRQNMLYECNISSTSSGLLIQPTAKYTITFTYKGGGEWLYLEDGDSHPLSVSDSTITIQRIGILYTFSRADDLYNEWGADIRDIIESESVSTDFANARHYVLSVRERQQASYIQWLLAAVAIVAVIAVTNHIVNRRRRQRLLLQLRQIQEVREERPQSVSRQVGGGLLLRLRRVCCLATAHGNWSTDEGRGMAAGGALPEKHLSGFHHSTAKPLPDVRCGVPRLHAHQAAHPDEGHCRRGGPRGEHHQHHAQAALQESVQP